MLWATIIVALVILDQATKLIVIKCIPLSNALTMIDKFFYLSHYENPGIAWSLFQNGRLIVIPLVIIVSVFLVYLMQKVNNRFLKTSFAFILSGALGNLIDRVIKGSVTDFFEFHFGSYIYPIFNMADIFVVVGVGVLLFYVIVIVRKSRLTPI
jgi:signal peptidase II